MILPETKHEGGMKELLYGQFVSESLRRELLPKYFIVQRTTSKVFHELRRNLLHMINAKISCICSQHNFHVTPSTVYSCVPLNTCVVVLFSFLKWVKF